MTGQKGGQYNMAESSSGAADQALSTTSVKEQQGAPNGRTLLQDPATSWHSAACAASVPHCIHCRNLCKTTPILIFFLMTFVASQAAVR
ncbi:unnamed protein product [Sphagnum jensenii]|uniref:Uncharacterized protein n=1 Tax=Sphagnum jensenii TaxID=128206 RepID=A0ABP1AXP4_9BRYO